MEKVYSREHSMDGCKTWLCFHIQLYVSRQQNNNLLSDACILGQRNQFCGPMNQVTAFDCESLSTALIILLHIVLSRANAHPCARTHLSILTGTYVVFKVPHLTAHHAKFLHSELKVGPLTQCNCLIHFRCHNILQLSFIHTNLLPCSQHSSLAAQHLHTASNEH